MEASFNLSYSRLPAEMASVFCELSIFPSDFDAAAEEAICQDQGHTQLSDLVTWSLVEFEEETSRYRLHDLVRIFAASLLDVVSQFSMKCRHAEYYINVLSKADELYVLGGMNYLIGRDLFDREWMNINTGQKWAEETIRRFQETNRIYFYSDLESALRLCSEYPASGAYVMQLRLSPSERIRWLRTAVIAAQLQKDSRMECSHLGNLGIAYIQHGEYHHAIGIFKQQLTISQKIGYIFGESNAIGNLGIAYAEIGETSQAIECFKKHLDMVRKNGYKRGEGGDLCNLGLIYAEMGEHQKAIEYHKQALAIAREIKDRRDEEGAVGNLGMVCADARDLGEVRKAIEYFEQHLAIAREIGDGDGEANALWNMSLSLEKLGQRAEAVDHARSALKIYEQIESPCVEMVRQTLAEWQE